MNQLWAPWRTKYIQAKTKPKGCIFCIAACNKKSSDSLIFTTAHSLVILNKFPYNNGHLMVSPLRHTSDIASLTQEEITDLWKALKSAKRILDKLLKPQGYNIGINLGDVAGAGITGHLHIHIVPRWKGDTNFMPVLAANKVISQSLEDLKKKLRYAYAKSNS